MAYDEELGGRIRVDPAESDELVASTGAEAAVMRGRPMAGWLRVDTNSVDTNSVDTNSVAAKDELARWVARGAAYARSLPRKP
jgi:hypothetical protein